MKRLYLIFIIILLVPCYVLPQNRMDNHSMGGELLLDYYYSGAVYLYAENKTTILDSLKHDYTNETFICFHVLDSCDKDSFLLVQPYWSLNGENASCPGLVKLSKNITIKMQFLTSIPLYNGPSENNPYLEVKPCLRYLPVSAYYKGWVYVDIPQECSAESIHGWLSPSYQCAQVYTTCN